MVGMLMSINEGNENCNVRTNLNNALNNFVYSAVTLSGGLALDWLAYEAIKKPDLNSLLTASTIGLAGLVSGVAGSYGAVKTYTELRSAVRKFCHK